MPGNSFKDKKLASEAGKKSARSRDSNAEIIRKYLAENIKKDEVVKKMFEELKTLTGRQYIESSIKIFQFILPQLKAMDLNVETSDIILQFQKALESV